MRFTIESRLLPRAGNGHDLPDVVTHSIDAESEEQAIGRFARGAHATVTEYLKPSPRGETIAMVRDGSSTYLVRAWAEEARPRESV